MNAEHAASLAMKEILCIEEHGEICLLLSLMLPGEEFRVTHVKDTEQADDYLKIRRPILVVIENNFFQNAGITYCLELKSKFPGIRIIMLSAEDGEIGETAIMGGIDVFLAKPFTKKELVDSVLFLLSQSKRA